MSKSKKKLFVQWCAKDALDGMMALSIEEELAYRRTIDLIYATNNNLDDDDEKMGWMTKIGVKKWKAVKAKLTQKGDEKLFIFAGKIRNARCDIELGKAGAFSEAQSARAKSRYSLENNETDDAHADAGAPAGEQPGHLPGDSPGSAHAPAGELPTDNRKPLTKRRKKESLSVDLTFPDWWETYPRKVAKPEAQIAYAKAIVAGATPAQLLEAAKQYRDERKGEDQKFTAHPATWLNKKRWLTDGQATADQPLTFDAEMEIWYRQFLKTGRWLDFWPDFRSMPENLKARLDAEHEREQLEANGQQKLTL